MTTELIPHEVVQDTLRKVNGNRKNPVEDGGCVYSDPENPDRHCIAGEVLSLLGLPLPEVGSGRNSWGIESLIEKEAFPFADESVALLLEAQALADNFQGGYARPRRWAEVKKTLREQGLI